MTELIELTKANEDMEGFSFLIRAMIKENYANKNFCSDYCVKIDGKNAIALDGKRCHVYNPKEEYEDGVYRAVRRLKTHIIL